MKLKGNNKGSTMLLVIIITAILFTLGGAMISVISVNYKAKSKESNRIQNLYEAEAGLDVAYSIIAKAFDAGLVAGNHRVNQTVTAIDERIKSGEKLSDKEIDDKKNEAFKLGFKEYINQTNDHLKVDKNQNLFSQSLNTYDENQPNEDIKYKYVINKNGTDVTFKTIDIDIKVENGLSKPIIECVTVDLNNDEYNVEVSSVFEKNTSTGVNKRKVEVTYVVKVPDYEDAKISDSSLEIDKPVEIDSKVISVDGNMKVEGNNLGNQFEINGDVFVKGNENDDESKNNIVYEKYKGGIDITGEQTKIKITGDVATSKTFNVNSYLGQVELQKNLYAGNVYIGKKDGNVSPKSEITINNVITDNDFAVKSNGSNISIENFYGINDKNTKSNTTGKEDKTSSSIIVNNDRNKPSDYTSLTVNNEAYIMGTAYINAQNKSGQYYQTGESVAIKGNYIAYTKPLAEFPNAEFDMYDSLQMADRENGQSLDVIEKSNYFKSFVEGASKGEITHGGVNLNRNKTYAIGAVVYSDGENLVVEKSNYTKSTNDAVLMKQKEYAREVYSMGNDDENSLKELYDNPKQKTVSDSIINFSNIKGFVEENKAGQKLILNNDPNKTVVLSDRNYTTSNNEILIKVEDKVDGLIISKGNIKLDGDFEFNGAIIGGGNLEILNRGSKNINYSEKIINNIINNNYLNLKNVFREVKSQINSNETKPNETVNNNSNINYSYKYNAKEYITSKNWKIRKNG